MSLCATKALLTLRDIVQCLPKDYTCYFNTAVVVLDNLRVKHIYVPVRVSVRVYFHVCKLHETCILHAMSKRGPHKHIMGMQCSNFMVPHMYTRVKMKL